MSGTARAENIEMETVVRLYVIDAGEDEPE